MPENRLDVQAIVTAALERPPGAAREAYLEESCAGDAATRARVEELLNAREPASRPTSPDAENAAAPATDVEGTADDTVGAGTPAIDEYATVPPADETIDHANPLRMPDSTIASGGSGDGLAPGAVIGYFGDYELRKELGRGGMGVVYEALQVSLNRPVALKMIKAGILAGDTELQRFQNEAEAVARLDHAGIVPVYEVGEHDGQRYFSMKLVEGGNLSSRLAAYTADPRAAAALLVEVAEAIHHAHMRGILHRDLKPANILIDAEGHPHVTDFGLATRVEGDMEMTQSGAILGTPAYMSPEQASGRRGSITTATDVYGLGAILYALLTGKAPFGGESVIDTLDAVRSRPPEPPKRFNARVPRDLETICLKCLEKDPRRRYASAHGLADDLRSWLDSRPIAARRVGAAERVRLWCRRRPAVAALSGAVLLATAAGSVAVFAVQSRANATLKIANNKLSQSNADLKNERARVEVREKQAVEAIRRFGDAIANEPALKDSPALKDLRRRLLREPIAFFRSLRDGLQADAGTRPESLEALASAAYQHAHLSQTVGDRDDAYKSFVEGQAILERLVREHPDEEAYRRKLAMTQLGMTNVLMARGQPREALDSIGRSRANYAELRKRENHPEYRRGLARCDLIRGILVFQSGQPEPAISAMRAAREEFAALLLQSTEPSIIRSEIAMCHIDIGGALEVLRRFPEALDEYRKGLEVIDRVVRDNTEVALYRLDQARIHSNIGKILILTGKLAEAEAAYDRARERLEALVADFPSTTDHQYGLASVYISLGQIAIATKRAELAESRWVKARAALERLATEHPESPDFASELGATIHNLGEMQYHSRHFLESRDLLLDALKWQRKAFAKNPGNPRYRECMVAHLAILGQAAAGANDKETVELVRKEKAQLAATDPRRIALEGRLNAVIKGETPRDNAERLALAGLAVETKRYVTAARLWTEAFAADAKIGENRQAQHRYNAACAALLSAGGLGAEALPDDAVRTRSRRQALGWLRAELEAWKQIAGLPDPRGRSLVAGTLEHWSKDEDLASVRDESSLMKLPEEERKAWQALWADVDALRKQTGAAAP